MTVFVGTSGWQYADWRSAFYPRGVPQRAWLAYYAARFRVVEVNNSFYRLPTHETVRRWAAETPDDFVFALKMTRYLTHIKRLKDPADAVQRFVDVVSELGPKLGPMLMQLPPSLALDMDRLRQALAAIPRGMRVAVEFRHASWYTAETNDLLTDLGVATCIADRKHELRGPLWRTTDWAYIRLHEGLGAPEPCYSTDALCAWAERIASSWSRDADVFLFFNNDAHACAVDDARVLGELLPRLGLDVSRTPERDAVQIERPAA